MRARAWRAGLAACALATILVVTAAVRAGGGDSPREPGGLAANRFLFFATLEGACEDALPAPTVQALLERDGKERYLHFVYGCPVCAPVIEGLRAFGMRREFFVSRKSDPLAADAPPAAVADLASKIASGDSRARGAALATLVTRWVDRRMERLRLTGAEKAEWRATLETGRKMGMDVLPSSAGFEHKACPSCDGASGFAFGAEK